MNETVPSSESESSILSQIESMLSKQEGGAAPAREPEPEADDTNAAGEGAQFAEGGAVVEDDADPEAPEADAEAPEFWTLAQLAEKLESSEDDLAKFLRVPGPDGKPVPLAEALTAWRTPAPDAVETQRVRTRVMELEGVEQQRQGLHAAALDELRNHIVGLAQHLKASEPDLQKLRVENPARWNELRIERIEQERQLERAAQRFDFERQQRMQAHRSEQAQKLQAAVPEWKDPARFRADLQEVESYILGHGFTREELEGLVDHRDWLIARKAMLFDKAPTQKQIQKDALAKRVANLPKVVTPGQPTRPDRGHQKEFESAMSELRQTGSGVRALELHLQREESRSAGQKLAAARRRV